MIHVSGETLTTGRMIHTGLIVHQQMHRPSNGNTNVNIEYGITSLNLHCFNILVHLVHTHYC